MPPPLNHRYYKKRRRVRHEYQTDDGLSLHVTKSFTRDADEHGNPIEHSPTIDCVSGKLYCDCEDFACRCIKFAPRATSPSHHLCKHLIRAILNDVENGRIKLPERNVRELKAAMHRTNLNPIFTEPVVPMSKAEIDALFEE
jgi:hypothetical protein